MKHIILPTDYSENAFNAFVYALGLTSKLGGDITAVHTYELPVFDSRAPRSIAESIIESEIQSQEEERVEVLAKMRLKSAEMGVAGQPVDLIVKDGELVAQICHVAEECNIDMVVLGTKGASGLKEVFWGSNAAKIIAEATCPVLAIPEGVTFTGIKKIAYFTNFDQFDLTILEKIAAFAQPLDAAIYLVHVNTSGNKDSASKLATLAEAVKSMTTLSVYTDLVAYEDLLDGMMAHIHGQKTDIVAMLTHRKDFLAKLFSVSYTRKTVFHTEIPLLSFKQDNR